MTWLVIGIGFVFLVVGLVFPYPVTGIACFLVGAAILAAVFGYVWRDGR